MELIEAMKTFDIVFVFILSIGVCVGSIGYALSEFIFGIMDMLKKKSKTHKEKIRETE